MSDNENVQPTNTDDGSKNTVNNSVQSQQELPEWARNEIKTANSEAAKYRVRANNIEAETTEKLTSQFNDQLKAVTEEKSAIATERDGYATKLLKVKVALNADIPGGSAFEFAELLQGSTEEELVEHANKLKSMFGTGARTPAVDHTQGFSNSNSQNPAQDFMNLLFPNK